MFATAKTVYEKSAAVVRDETPPKPIQENDALAIRLSAALQHHGGGSGRAESVAAALEAKQPYNPLFDLVFSDAFLAKHKKSEIYYATVFLETVKGTVAKLRTKNLNYPPVKQWCESKEWQSDLTIKLKPYLSKYDGHSALAAWARCVLGNFVIDNFFRKKKEEQLPEDEDGKPVEFSSRYSDTEEPIPTELSLSIRSVLSTVKRQFSQYEWTLLTAIFHRGTKQKAIAESSGKDSGQLSREIKLLTQRFGETLQRELDAKEYRAYHNQIVSIISELFVNSNGGQNNG
ncbi:hypothetical protein FACS1894189_3190 [Planctomycetales bacterium]|nr:hypothetical protein FACS1894189_3190 [Planctomycetales bacterium]